MGIVKEILMAPFRLADEFTSRDTWHCDELPATDAELADYVAKRDGLTWRERSSLHHDLGKMSRKSKKRMFGF